MNRTPNLTRIRTDRLTATLLATLLASLFVGRSMRTFGVSEEAGVSYRARGRGADR
jgi:hypothetical protein